MSETGVNPILHGKKPKKYRDQDSPTVYLTVEMSNFWAVILSGGHTIFDGKKLQRGF